MAGNADTIYRQWKMLQLIPRHPRRRSTAKIHEKLQDEFQTSKRTVERDLEALSLRFGYLDKQVGRTKFWSWPIQARPFDIPGIGPTEALAWSISSKLLQKLAPQSKLPELQRYFAFADSILENESKVRLARWRQRVTVVEPGIGMQPAAVDPQVRSALHEALYEGRQVQCTYQSRGKPRARSRRLHPLGLVFRDGVEYVVATVDDYSDPRQLALHRFKTCEALKDSVVEPEGFDFARFVAKSFAYLQSDQPLELELSIDPYAAQAVQERPLSNDQSVEQVDDTEVIVRATVPDSIELRWWLRGMGEAVEVLAPASLRAEIAQSAKNVADYYRD